MKRSPDTDFFRNYNKSDDNGREIKKGKMKKKETRQRKKGSSSKYPTIALPAV